MTRRFEFEEGGSSKFWEVSVEGSDMTVCYGRIGTSGQSKTKGFASGDAAQKEADKLVVEKTKKGYQEVAGSGSPSPKPAAVAKTHPAPQTVASVPSAEPAMPSETAPAMPRESTPVAENAPPKVAAETAMVLGELVSFVPPDWVREEAELSTQAPLRARKALSFAETWKPMLAHYKLWEQQRRLSWPPEDPFLQRARLRLELQQEGDGFDVDLEAFTFVISRLASHFDTGEAPEAQASRSLAHWTARSSPAIAARTLLRAESFVPLDTSRPAFVRVRDDAEWGKAGPVWTVLRALHDQVRVYGREALEAVLREALPPTHAARRAALAYLLDDEDEAIQAVVMARAAGNVAQAVMALGITPSPTDAADILARGFHPEKAVRAVLRHGLALAEPVLAKPSQNRIPLLACYPSMLAARALVPMLESKSTRKQVGLALAHMPVQALIALNEAKSKKTKYRDAIDALIATLSAAQSSSPNEPGVEHATSELHIEAALSEAPGVFQAPPWRQKKKASKEASFSGLIPHALEPTIDLSSIDPKTLVREVDRARYGAWKRVPVDTAITQARASKFAINASYVLACAVDELEMLRAAGVLPMLDASDWVHDGYSPGLTAILSRHGVAALPALVALAPTLKPSLASELSYAGAVEMGPLATQWVASKSSRKAAEQWVRRFPRHAAAALLPIALCAGSGKAATDRDRARALLMLIGKSHRDVILEEARHHSADVERATAELLDADPLEFAPSKPPKLMDGLESLPRIALRDGRLLPVECNAILLEMLAFTAMDPPYAGIEQTRAACDPRSLDIFVEALVRTWIVAGMPTAHEWAVRAVAVIGTDKAARFLFDRGRAWAQDNQKQRAVLAIEVLGAMGTDLALSLVGRMSRSSLRQYMKDRATELLAEIASNRGLSSDELEDRTAPDLGLDAEGTLLLDFGPRAFRVGFDEHLSPFVQTSEGERLEAFPRPNKNDDAAKAKAASETWKLLKSEAEKVSRDQVARLERMMADERRVEADVFVHSFVHHPLIGHLTKRLVWGAFDSKGALLKTFRVSEDKSLATVEDDTYALPSDAEVGLIHPYTLRTESGLTARWGQVLADYAVMQPFGQLSRPTETFAPDAVGARYANKKAPTSLLYTLRAHGWRADTGEYGETEGFTREVSGYRYQLQLRQPMAQGEPSKLHDVSLTASHDADATKPSAVQLAEFVHQLDRVIVA